MISTKLEHLARVRAREGWGGRPGPDRRPNCDVGYDYVTLTRGATALAVVASTFAVATSFPSKPPALNAMGGLRYGRCHGKPAAAYGQ